MLLSQFRRLDGQIQVVAREGTEAYEVASDQSLYDLALWCASARVSLSDCVLERGLGAAVDLDQLCEECRVLPPVLHPDPAHVVVSGSPLALSGKADGSEKAAWFYRGAGDALVAPSAPVALPLFDFEGAVQPRIAGLYVIGTDALPCRIGFTLSRQYSNRFSREAGEAGMYGGEPRIAFGPELLVSVLPGVVSGTFRLMRGGEVVAMSPIILTVADPGHSVAELEKDLFGRGVFLRPGDVHIHMFGTPTAALLGETTALSGDVFEIEAAPFGLPLRNSVAAAPLPGLPETQPVRVL